MSTIGFIDGMTTALIAEANYLLQNTFTKKGYLKIITTKSKYELRRTYASLAGSMRCFSAISLAVVIADSV